ncbi:MAG: hypothetical protein K5771_03590 [Oscillospiraceae bacterium]|nr:hypothetical protein [Oscillospiraceae bacterium]
MKKKILRLLTLSLCIMMVFAMFPVPADAASNSYSTCSSKKVLLVLPASGSLLSIPLHAKADGNQKNGGIYYLPKPEAGNGDLGTVKKGTNVTIFAEEDGYYFFMTNSGRMGWNKVEYFTEPEEYTDYYLPGDSGLTTSDLDDVKDFLRSNERAGGSNKFYPAKPVVIVKKGESVKLTIYADYRKNSTVNAAWNNYYHSLSWGRGSAGKGSVTIKGKNLGSDTIDFTNYYTDRYFEVLVIVVE